MLVGSLKLHLLFAALAAAEVELVVVEDFEIEVVVEEEEEEGALAVPRMEVQVGGLNADHRQNPIHHPASH